MALTINHAYTATGTDAGNGEVNKARWNAPLTYTGTVDVANGGTGATTARLAAQGLGVPYIFAISGAAQTVGATTAETVLATISFAGGELGANGQLVVVTQWTTTNNANNKNQFVRIGGVAGTAMQVFTNTVHAGSTRYLVIANNNSQSAQKTLAPPANSIGIGQFGSAGVTATVNTASAWDLIISGNKAVSTDTLTLESYQIIVYYGA